jgi:5-methylthioribose kinase
LSNYRKKHTSGKEEETETAPGAKLKVPFDYTEHSVTSLPAYLAKNAPAAMEALEATCPEDLNCVEMGDGNLNLVFIVTNTKNQKSVICKQSLPYVRCVGESWPLTLDRAYFEYRALSAEKEACPNFVPSLYYFSKPNGLMVMEYIPPPNIILRKGLIQGIRYPTMASDVGTFCAHTLFKNSGFKLSETELRANVSF